VTPRFRPAPLRPPAHGRVAVLGSISMALLLLPASPSEAQQPLLPDGTVQVGVVKQPYTGERNVPEISSNPDYIHAAGLERLLEDWGARLPFPVENVQLTPEEDREYGAWHRLGLANAHQARTVARFVDENLLTVALQANCSSLAGVLAGLQGPGPHGDRRRVGLVFFDAHGDFNTPETTLSGMLGGMPVAVAAGHGLERLRRTSGLEVPIEMDHIVWGGVRDLDPLEADRFEEYDVRQLSVDDIRTLSSELHDQMRHLAAETDVIYVHIDMDVLDPAEVPGHGLTVADGPSSAELARALTEMFRYEKVAALALASTPAHAADPTGVSRQAALNLIEGAIRGVRERR
jgi:arginase